MDKKKRVETMKKTIVLIVAFLSLTACAQSRQESKDSSPSKTEQISKESSTVKNEKGLQFVVGPQYEGKESNVIELGKKLTKEHPELGNQGSLSINFTGATFSSNQQEYAVFLLINKAGFQIDKDFEFSLNWKYDDFTTLDNRLFPNHMLLAVEGTGKTLSLDMKFSRLSVGGDWEGKTELSSRYQQIELQELLKTLFKQ